MIKLSDIMPIENPSSYKLHAAKRSEGERPLDVFVRSWDEWVGWQQWPGNRNDFNREYVISFMDFYPQRGYFLFGGIFKINGRTQDSYDLELVDTYKEYIGRLIVKNINTKRGRAFNFEKHYEKIEVVELLPKQYMYSFPGYENVHLRLKNLRVLIENKSLAWKTAIGELLNKQAEIYEALGVALPTLSC